MHSVTTGELDMVASLSNSVHLAFFGLSAGAVITLGVTLVTVPMATPIMAAGFISATIVSSISTLFFGVMARISHKDARRKIEDIKRGK